MGKYRVEQADPSKARSRCRKWKVWVRTSQRYPNGRWKWTCESFDGTLSEARARGEELAAEVDAGKALGRTSWTFAAYAQHWNDAKLAAGQITESTHAKNAHLLAALGMHVGGIRLSEVSPSDIEQAYAALRSGDSPSGKPLSGTTLACAHGVGYSMMRHAVESGLCIRNPFEIAANPKADTAERRALDVAGAERFAESLDPTDRHELALLLMVGAGLRRGECCGLRWDDVEGGAIAVRRSMRADGSTGAPKGGRSRVVPLTPALAGALDAARAHQARRMGIHHVAQDGSTHVLADSNGVPLTPNALGRWWARHRAEHDMEGWTLHQLRHTFCSNLAEADVHPRIMQQLMGHSSERTSMQVYTHVHNQQLVDAMAALHAAKSGK